MLLYYHSALNDNIKDTYAISYGVFVKSDQSPDDKWPMATAENSITDE